MPSPHSPLFFEMRSKISHSPCSPEVSRDRDASRLELRMAASEAPAPEAPENFPDCPPPAAAAAGHGWLSPRISFSTDFGVTGKDSPKREEVRSLEWSTEFEFSLSIECHGGSPADEIFFEGKLLPLQLRQSQPILLIKDLLEEESGTSSVERSCSSSGCPSPLIVKSASYPPVGCGSPTGLAPTCGGSWKEIFGRNSKSSRGKYPGQHTLKLVTLFIRRHLGELGRTPPQSPVLLAEKSNSVSSDVPEDKSPSAGTGTVTGTGTGTARASLARSSSSSSASASGSSHRGPKSVDSGRILWKNLERCSKDAEQRKARARRRHATTGDKGSGSGSFSSNVRVAPVLNVPMCMGPVRETKSTLAGLRKLLSGKKGNLQRVSWACPGGTV